MKPPVEQNLALIPKQSLKHWSYWSLGFNAVRTPSAYHGCKVFPSWYYNSSVSITLVFSHIRCVLDLAPSAILGHCCFRGADFLVDILMMFRMTTRKVFFNLLVQKERYVALWYGLGLNFDSCHDNKWHVHFPEWMVSFQTHTECYQIWQVLNDGMSRILDSTTGDLGCCKCTLPPGLAKFTLGFFLVWVQGFFSLFLQVSFEFSF